MPLVDMEKAGLTEWERPETAVMADAGSCQRMQVALVAACLKLMNETHDSPDRAHERKLEREFEMAYKAGVLLATVLKAEKH